MNSNALTDHHIKKGVALIQAQSPDFAEYLAKLPNNAYATTLIKGLVTALVVNGYVRGMEELIASPYKKFIGNPEDLNSNDFQSAMLEEIVKQDNIDMMALVLPFTNQYGAASIVQKVFKSCIREPMSDCFGEEKTNEEPREISISMPMFEMLVGKMPNDAPEYMFYAIMPTVALEQRHEGHYQVLLEKYHRMDLISNICNKNFDPADFEGEFGAYFDQRQLQALDRLASGIELADQMHNPLLYRQIVRAFSAPGTQANFPLLAARLSADAIYEGVAEIEKQKPIEQAKPSKI